MNTKRLFTQTRRAQALVLVLLLACFVTAQAQIPGFDELRSLGGLTVDTVALVAGDINGDGAPDIITAAGDGSLWLNLNDGAGYYPVASLIGEADAPVHSLRLADLDVDGDLDLIGATAKRAFIYLNVNGVFDNDTYAPVGPDLLPPPNLVTIVGIEVAYINSSISVVDTHPDIIIAVNGGQSAAFLNDGSAGFYFGAVTCSSPSQIRCFGGSTQSVGTLAVGDLTGDNKNDILIGRAAAYSGANSLFANDGLGNFGAGSNLPSDYTSVPSALALGDLNGDGLMDVVVQDFNSPTHSMQVYINNGNSSFAAPVQAGASAVSNILDRPELVDIDLDGDLDILFGESSVHYVLVNNGTGVFYSGAVDCDNPTAAVFCFARGGESIRDTIPVDMDNDGDLDLAVIHSNNAHTLYINDNNASLPRNAGVEVFAVDGAAPHSLVLGDLNDDGWLDAVAGTASGASVLYNQLDGTFAVTQALATATNYNDLNLADLDNDGDLDLLASLNNNNLVIFFNYSGGSFLSGTLDCGDSKVSCLGNPTDQNINAAIGDLDGNGSLDILANRLGGERMLYLNDGFGGFGTTRTFGYPATGTKSDVALADLDGDGDLDIILVQSLAIPGHIYLNDGQGNFHTGPFNCATPPANVRCFDNGKGTSLDTADLNADAALDIIVGKESGQSRAYLNDGLGNFNWAGSSRSFGGMRTAFDVAAVDADGDGDLDIATANGNGQPGIIYINDGLGTFGSLVPTREFGGSADVIIRIAAGDISGDGMDDLALLRSAASRANLSVVRNFSRAARGAARLPDNMPTVWMGFPGDTPPGEGYTSPVIFSTNQISFPYKLFDLQGNPVSRIEVYFSPDGGGEWHRALPAAGTQVSNLAASPTGTAYTYTWDVAASGFFGKSDRVVLRMLVYSGAYPTPWSYTAATSYSFRMRGMQVRVVDSDGLPVADANVLRSTNGGDFKLIRDGAGTPRQTNANGYLEGRGALQTGDELIALWPAEQSTTNTLYHTNATPTTEGADGEPITAFGVQNIVVSEEHPLLLLNLTISMQWDARNDPAYLDRLEYDLQTASQRLYDWSNGQIALGELTVYQARGLWNDALIRIYANNRFRPTAMKGGIVSATIPDPDVAEITYSPGQIHIGAVWNRYGTPGSSLEQDWPRALAHEVNHYALFLDDNYLGMDDSGNVIPVDSCPGVMSDPYRKDYPYDEYHPALDWDDECAETLSNRLTGRSDWETITTFYSDILFNTVETGPNGQPLEVTQINFIAEGGVSATLADPTFYLTDAANVGARIEPGRQARAFLFQDGWAIDLGKPTIDHILARGAKPGDRVCLYEPDANRLGCETVTIGDEQIALTLFNDWQPQIVVSPVSSTTITVLVNGVDEGVALKAQLYPVMNVASAAQTMNYAGGEYSTTFSLGEPAMEGYVLVYVNESEPRREAIVDYAIGGSPANIRGSNANIRGSNAPASSTDGQVILFTPDTQMNANEFYTLQALSQAPDLPEWAGTASRPYRVAASEDAPDLAGSSITFSYMGDEVVAGEEGWLKVYFWDGASWLALPTRLDPYFNTASAPAEHPGIYILLSSIEINLHSGWNLVAYPLQITLNADSAFSSLDQLPILTAYGYDATAPDPWKLYHPAAPDWVNDLETLRQGQGYWIYALQAATWRLSGGMQPAEEKSEDKAMMPTPPATFYGWVHPDLGTLGFIPAVGTPVQAYVGSTLCAQTTAFEVNGELVYKLEMPEAAGCGGEGAVVTFRSGATDLKQSAEWTTQSPVQVDFFDLKYLYLPMMIR